MEIVILDGYTLNPGDLSWAGLEKLGNVTVYDRTCTTDASEAIVRIGKAEIVYTNKTPITKEILEATNIKFIGVLATDYNVVDTATASEMGIPVCNVPCYGTDAVGQFAIALLLEICHNVGHHDGQVKAGEWGNRGDFCFWDSPLIELSGKTMGIIGFGRIGQSTARIASALGMKVIAYDKYQSEQGKSLADYVELDTLLASSDVISLHCPLFSDTENLICKQNIDKMKDGVIILNNSRGQLVVEKDLAEALNSGKVYAAGLNVVSSEPIKQDNPLLKAKNCIITPHISWAPKESRERLLNVAVNNLEEYLKGNIINKVN